MQAVQVKIDKLELSIDWLKYVQRLTTGVVVSAIGIGFAVIFFMLRDTKQDIQKLETDIKEIRTLLIELIQRYKARYTLETDIQTQASKIQSKSKGKPACYREAYLFYIMDTQTQAKSPACQGAGRKTTGAGKLHG